MCPYLEDEFERKRMVGAISIDLRAAYDSVNKRFHHLLVRFLNRQLSKLGMRTKQNKQAENNTH